MKGVFMYANHKKVSRINGKKIYIYIFIAVVLSLLMIPAVSFASNINEELNESPLIDQRSKDSISDDISTNPVVKQNNIEMLGDESNYLCLKPHNSGTNAKFKIGGSFLEGNTVDFKYSYDLTEWTDVFSTYSEEEIIDFNIDKPIYFKGNNPEGFNVDVIEGWKRQIVFNIAEDEIDASGSIMSLIDGGTGTIFTIPNSYCFQALFRGNTKLISCPSLPATILKENCYLYIFAGCSNLLYPPEIIPANELANGSCDFMFQGCESLLSAPKLPCLNLAPLCYQHMFSGCSSLTEAPELPATSLCERCYDSMFFGTGITKTPYLPAQFLAPGCYNGMFFNCHNLTSVNVNFTNWDDANSSTNNWLSGVPELSTSEFWCPENLDKTLRDVSHIPNSWTIRNHLYATADVASYSNQYDGTAHGVTISNIYPEGATVLYSSDDISYSTNEITRTDVGIMLVYVKIVKDSFEDFKARATIEVKPKEGATATVGAKEKYYGQEDPTYDVAFTNIVGDTPVLGTDYVLEREKGEDVKADDGTYEVKLYWIRDNNYNLTVTNGSLKINKANDLKLVANPASKKDVEPEPTLTAHMEGLKFNDSFDPTNYDYYRIDKVTEGNATTTLKPELTIAGKAYYGQNYDVDVAGFALTSTLTVYSTVGEQAFTYTTNAFNINYNGQENGFKVNVNNPPVGIVVEYKTSSEGSYSQTPPTFKDAGTYTVYFRISAPGYSTVETSQQVKINPAPATLVADYSCIYKNVGDPDPELNATLFGAVNGESLVKGTDYNISRIAGEDAGAYDISLSVISGTDITKNYQIQVAPSKFFILGSGDVPPVPPTPPTPDDPGTNPSFVNSIIAQTGDDNLPIVIALIVVACACGGYVSYRKLRKK